jgi:hypothetical protein
MVQHIYGQTPVEYSSEARFQLDLGYRMRRLRLTCRRLDTEYRDSGAAKMRTCAQYSSID